MKKPLKVAKISASLMCADVLNLERDISILESCGVDLLHLDIMDGNFVPNITFGFESVFRIAAISKTPKEFHMMVQAPERFLDAFPISPKDTFIFHIESTKSPKRLINKVKKRGLRVGIACNPQTPIYSFMHHLAFIDQILIMMTKPGFKRQRPIERTALKVKEVNSLRKEQNLSLAIEVDGGISADRLPHLYRFGANIFVGGTSTIFRDDEIGKNTRELVRFAASL